MNKRFQYVAVITGEIVGRSKANAYIQASMGISLTTRLLTTPHQIAIEIREITQDPIPAKEPFVIEESDG